MDAFTDIIHLFTVAYHASRATLGHLELGELPLDDLQASWLSLSLGGNLSLLDFLDICQVELQEQQEDED